MEQEEARLVSLGYKVLAPVVCGTSERSVDGLLLERSSKLHADRQQGGDATTAGGVLYIRCLCDACSLLPLELHSSGGSIYSGNAFEAHAGRSFRKKWKETIRVQPQNISLKAWLASVGREVLHEPDSAEHRREPPTRGELIEAALAAVAAGAATPKASLPRGTVAGAAAGAGTEAAAAEASFPTWLWQQQQGQPQQAGAAAQAQPAAHGNPEAARTAAAAQAGLVQLALRHHHHQQQQPPAAAAVAAGAAAGLHGQTPDGTTPPIAPQLLARLIQQLQPQGGHSSAAAAAQGGIGGGSSGAGEPGSQPAAGQLLHVLSAVLGQAPTHQPQQHAALGSQPIDLLPPRPASVHAAAVPGDNLTAAVVGLIQQLQLQQGRLDQLHEQVGVQRLQLQLLATAMATGQETAGRQLQAQADSLAALQAARQQDAEAVRQMCEVIMPLRAALEGLAPHHRVQPQAQEPPQAQAQAQVQEPPQAQAQAQEPPQAQAQPSPPQQQPTAVGRSVPSQGAPVPDPAVVSSAAANRKQEASATAEDASGGALQTNSSRSNGAPATHGHAPSGGSNGSEGGEGGGGSAAERRSPSPAGGTSVLPPQVPSLLACMPAAAEPPGGSGQGRSSGGAGPQPVTAGTSPAVEARADGEGLSPAGRKRLRESSSSSQ